MDGAVYPPGFLADAVRGLRTTEVRKVFALIDEQLEKADDDDDITFHDLFLPGVGMSVAEFCIGYLLKQ